MKKQGDTNRYWNDEHINWLIDSTCFISGLPEDVLLGDSRVNNGLFYHRKKCLRRPRIIDYRHILIHLCLKHHDIPLHALKRRLKYDCHTSIIYARNKIKERIDNHIQFGTEQFVIDEIEKIERHYQARFYKTPMIIEAERLVGMHKRRLVA